MATLVVEDGTGLANANSYSSLAELDTYHSNYESVGWKNSRATGTVYIAAVPTVDDEVSVGVQLYIFKAIPTGSKHVRIGATAEASVANLVAAINGTGSVGYQYYEDTMPNAAATASIVTSGLLLTAIETGIGGNAVVIGATFATPASNYVVGTMLSGGSDLKTGAAIRGTRYLDQKYGQRWLGERTNETQALDHPRTGIYDRDGYLQAKGTLAPDLKKAHAEASLACLLGDPLANIDPASSAGLTSESVSVGPISISQSYLGAQAIRTAYTKVDGWVANLIGGTGELVRG